MPTTRRRLLLALLAPLALALHRSPAAARDHADALDCPTRDCGWIYDPATGDPDHGVAAGTAFDDLPDDWACPNCGRPKHLW